VEISAGGVVCCFGEGKLIGLLKTEGISKYLLKRA
jgi:hypothetical protein